MKTKINHRKYIPFYIVTSLIFITLIVSIILYNTKGYGTKRTFIFPSVDAGEYIVETRYLPKNPAMDEINFYVDELLLGPGVERTKFIFTAGTKKLSCFEREGILYLNLSSDLLKMGGNVIEIKEGVELLKKNIFMNFSHIKQVELFIDGKYAYEEN